MMTKTMKKILIHTCSFLLLFGALLHPIQQVKAQTLSGLIGLDFADRDAAYENLSLNMTGWKVGTILSNEPYAVVTQLCANCAAVRVWTGIVVRESNDLMTYWDELRLDGQGKVVVHLTDLKVTIRGYFAAKSQQSFRTKAYLGKIPWADIPTDAETIAAKTMKVPSTGILNLYGITFQDPDMVVSPTLGPVKKSQEIPSLVPSIKPWVKIAIPITPRDINDHWAKNDILDLMGKTIIDGFEDQTIRPEDTLSRAQFISLVVKALGLETPAATVVGYQDVQEHWAAPLIAAAQQVGVLDQQPASLQFNPDSPMPRMEMATILARILNVYGRYSIAGKLSFKDVGSLPEIDRNDLQAVVNVGIIGGYDDNTFSPTGLLKRAEGFKVISKLIPLL